MRISSIFLVLSLLSIGCGSSQFKNETRTSPHDSKDRKALSKATSAFERDQYEHASSGLTKLLASKDARVRERARLLLGRIKGAEDVGHGGDLLLMLHKQATDDDVRAEAGYYAGLLAVKAKRCMTARPLLNRVIESARQTALHGQAALSLSRCEDDDVAFTLLSIAIAQESTRPQAEEATKRRLKGATSTTLTQLIAQFADGGLSQLAARDLIDRRDPTTTLAALNAAREALSQELNKSDAGVSAPAQIMGITVILPLKGRARLSGIHLKGDFDLWAKKMAEDRILPHKIRFVDGSDETSIHAAFQGMSERGELATVGLFTKKTAPAAVKAASSFGIATLMLTGSDAPIKDPEAPTWRISPSSLNVARIVAGSALENGAQKLLVIRSDDSYGRQRARWLKAVWNAAKGPSYHELVGSPNGYDRLASQAAALDFDAVFIAVASAQQGAQILRYLAQEGVWSKNKGQSFSKSESRREAFVFGTPEWYTPSALGQLGRYGFGVQVPVPYSGETGKGEKLKTQLDGQISPKRLPLFAIALDALEAIKAVSQSSRVSGRPFLESMRDAKYKEGSSVGFNFANKDALNNLYLLEIGPAGFRLKSAD